MASTKFVGTAGEVYVTSLLVEDCEDAWTADAGGATANTDAVDYKVGAASVKCVIPAALGTNVLIAHEAGLGALDLTDYTTLFLWVKSSLELTLNQMQILLDDTAACDSPLEFLQVPALTAATWTKIALTLADPSLLGGINAVGLKQIAALGAQNFWLDDIRAVFTVAGIKSWTVDLIYDTGETTSFDDVGVKAHLPTVSGWSGTFEGYKTGAPLTIASEVALALKETQTTGQIWTGQAIITGLHGATAHEGIATYAYDFQGTGDLTIPTA